MKEHLSNTKFIYAAYEAIGDLTPIKTDCGKLCDKACCKGDDAGMLLFPCEELIFEGVPGFRIHEMEYMNVPGIKLLMCDGECTRNMRPLSCRIFPVAPNIDKTGNITIQPDRRGRRLCPIWDLKNRDIDETFIESVQKAFEILAEDEAMLFFMQLLSDEQEKLRRFYKK